MEQPSLKYKKHKFLQYVEEQSQRVCDKETVVIVLVHIIPKNRKSAF